MTHRLYLYPVWVRIWHWLFAVSIIILMFTGICLQYSSVEYSILSFRYAIALHDIAGIVLSILLVFFIIANAVTANGKYYKINEKQYFKQLFWQFRYYLFGVFKREDPPYPITEKRKFNPLQKISYIAVIYILCVIVIISGFVLFFPEMIFKKIFGFGGIHFVDLIHVITGYFISLFLIIHVYFCTFGTTAFSNFKSMISGWHVND